MSDVELLNMNSAFEYLEAKFEILDTQDIRSSLETLNRRLSEFKTFSPDIVISEEGIWNVVKGLLTSIGNVMGHVANTFKTNVFKFYKDLKRTEIRYYNESNMASMTRIFRINVTDVAELNMPFPNGFKTTYLDAFSKAVDAFSNIDILTRANTAVTISQNILVSLQNGDTMATVINSGIASADITNVRPSVEKFDRCFDTNSNTTAETRQFKKLFGSVAEVKKCNEIALSCDKYVDQTSMAHKKIQICHDVFEKIIKTLERSAGANATKNDIDNLATLAYTLGETFDMFASTLLHYHTVEHNLVEVYKEIRRQLSL